MCDPPTAIQTALEGRHLGSLVPGPLGSLVHSLIHESNESTAGKAAHGSIVGLASRIARAVGMPTVA